MATDTRRQLVFARLLAFLCLTVILVSTLAAPIHKHDAGQEATCLICHATQRAGVISIANDAGKPTVAAAGAVASLHIGKVISDFSYSVRTPRAPPTLLLSL
jgi:hypothetical protein